ncbi:MAG: hypothetical protein U0166_16100 [Acidobacteriota bacterium]
MRSTTLAAIVLVATHAWADVNVDGGTIRVDANNVSMRDVVLEVALRAGFAVDGAELLPAERVSLCLDRGPIDPAIVELMTLAPKVNYIVVRNPGSGKVVRLALSSRAERVANQGTGPDMPGPRFPEPAAEPPATEPIAPPPQAEGPRYIAPEKPPVYIKPDGEPQYIPVEEPPKYIPADGPPIDIPPPSP